MSDKQKRTHFKDTIAYKHSSDPDMSYEKQERLNSANSKSATSNEENIDVNDNHESTLQDNFDKFSQEAIDQLSHYNDIGKALSHHFSGLSKLIRAEARLSISAYTQVIKLSAIFIALSLIAYLSICISIGAVVYVLSASLSAAILVSTVCQILLIGGIALSIKLTKRHIGFNKTKTQIEELKNELTHLF